MQMNPMCFKVFVAVSVVGFVRSATVPLLYELAAEITYPQPEVWLDLLHVRVQCISLCMFSWTR